eukprot:UN09001
MAGGKNKLTQEEEVLLQDFSRTVSKKSQALFYGNALMVALLPLWLFWKVHLMDPMSYAAPLHWWYPRLCLLGCICLQEP